MAVNLNSKMLIVQSLRVKTHSIYLFRFDVTDFIIYLSLSLWKGFLYKLLGPFGTSHDRAA